MRLQLRIARCADMLARQDREKTLRPTLDDTVKIWMQAEQEVIAAHAS